MRSTKFKEISARVLLTPMPSDGLDQFTFMRPLGSLQPSKVEALLQLGDNLNPVDLLRAINKLFSSFVVNGETDLTPEDMLSLEKTVSFIADCWEIERGTFTPLHENFTIEAE